MTTQLTDYLNTVIATVQTQKDEALAADLKFQQQLATANDLLKAQLRAYILNTLPEILHPHADILYPEFVYSDPTINDIELTLNLPRCTPIRRTYRLATNYVDYPASIYINGSISLIPNLITTQPRNDPSFYHAVPTVDYDDLGRQHIIYVYDNDYATQGGNYHPNLEDAIYHANKAYLLYLILNEQVVQYNADLDAADTPPTPKPQPNPAEAAYRNLTPNQAITKALAIIQRDPATQPDPSFEDVFTAITYVLIAIADRIR